ncbi:MAG: hypothetical protein JWP65_3205 [Ramlibacter sp.]|jgi:hypothetical protein|uniref:hypothetical protein n=1 Tax=Ramlibacter sp. TaxID=1917967 RepID=UPI002631A508|nr:hypothetical protein [Ramlibacter sp.]MDB5752784.1 hypothetical protein [Ramlibacter sp.]
MKFRIAGALVTVAALVACGDGDRVPTTSVLGGVSSGPRPAASAPLTDSSGRPIPEPPLPGSAQAQVVRSDANAALAVWLQDKRVVAAAWAPATGWSAPAPLEEIYGEASQPQLASNGRGAALAVWQHTVGSIQSLRFSRFDANGWSLPDVMPGALPRPPAALGQAGAGAPQLHMDPQGNALAQWPSGFAADQVQTARYVAGRGWTRALSEPVTATATQPATTSVQ